MDQRFALTDHHAIATKAFTNVFMIGYPKETREPMASLPTTKRTMTRLKDQIRLAKKAIKEAKKNPNLYTDEELQYMAMQLVRAKIALKVKQIKHKQEKGFSNEFSETINSDSRSGENDGVRSEGEQPQQPGEP